MSTILYQNEFLKNVAKLILYCQENNYMVTGGELYRTKDQQEIYYKAGLSKTLNSKHLTRLAIDLNFFLNFKLCSDRGDFALPAQYWKSLHPKNQSGYFWGWDYNHFEMSV